MWTEQGHLKGRCCLCDAFPDLVHSYNLKNVKNIHGGVLLLVKLQATTVTLLHGCFSTFFK